MDDIQKQARKIRAKIRKDAIKEGISTQEYRDKYGFTKDAIRKMAGDERPKVKTNKTTKKEIEYKIPFDNVSNKPKFNSLQFDKPILRIVRNDMFGFDFLVYLADNGHYLPKEKIYRKDTGQATQIA